MEKDIEAYLCRQVRAAGGRAIKLVSPGWTGVPDRLILLPRGRVVFAELKDTGKKPTPRQVYVHEQLRGMGFKVFVPDSKTAVNEMIREVL